MSVQTIAEQKLTARKTHWCSNCGREIVAGSRCFRGRYADRGDAWVFKSHLNCRDMAQEAASEGYAPEYWDGVPPLMDDQGVKPPVFGPRF